MTVAIKKPAEDIPDDEWNALSLSDQAFLEFIYEVFDYFDEVVRQKLGWKPEQIQINQGKNNIVLAFNHDQKRYLFRVPKYGRQQLQRYMRAAQLLEDQPFFSERIYIDGNCMIETYAPGVTLNQDAPSGAYIALAKALNLMHQQKGQGFGGLRVGTTGHDDSVFDHYLPMMTERIEDLKQLFPNQAVSLDAVFELWQQKLNSISSPLCLCHGDLWSDNVLYDKDTDHLTIIDWDSCGIYHREKDLHFLLSDDVPSANKDLFFQHYDTEPDWQLMSWYRVTMNVLYFKADRGSHLQTAVNHFFEQMKTEERLVIDSDTI
ncbi:aminoglycoside phosphotransferase family protein [Maribrevibacterium harenarium]|uniref:Aminoglycoside phosphotransferase family protein n=1 Tax=Maribrevibacterium harenarium TaxID=2589817 RepID=A0A501WCS5_9GAMM|nr:aminoglycoside phosphotransferase family protein [Maribrevibacterium harenarium]TPE46622.1 aminoglycoside phosphotransferase family protein [Maribrevibacterium harenarium]